jgi:hypothetical protein
VLSTMRKKSRRTPAEGAGWLLGPGILAAVLLAAPGAGLPADFGVGGAKLVVRDRTALGSGSKVVFLARDGSAGITAGSDDDPNAIQASLEIHLPYGSSGRFDLPTGAWDGASGWKHSGKVTRFLNRAAPAGASAAKVALVKRDSLIKLVGRDLGDTPLDLVAASPITGPVETIFTVQNGEETHRFCSRFTSCRFKAGGGGLIASLTCSDGIANACPEIPAEKTFTRITKAQEPTHLFVIDADDMSGPERVMIASLQGLVASTSAEQIYIRIPQGGYTTWLSDLQTTYGINHTDIDDPWWLVNYFKSHVEGYLLYQNGDSSVNAATSLAGVERGLVVEASIEGAVQAQGLTALADLRGLDEAWVKDNHGARLNPLMAVEQMESFEHQLRDYAVLSCSLTFYDGNSGVRASLVEGLAPDGVTFGWGDASLGEDVFVHMSSERGVFTIPADHAHNLAPLSGIPTVPLTQKTHSNPTVEPNVHYVSFVMTDGDNVQWLLGGFQSGTGWFASPERGNFDMAYGIPPALCELAPSVMRWYYDNASTSPGRDFFVVGPSGGGYLYPSAYPPADLAIHVDRLGDWMACADLNVVQILDQFSFETRRIWDEYTRRSEIEALIYLEYYDYSAQEGDVRWSRGKPVIAARTKLWGNLPQSDPTSILDLINNRAARDPTSPQGYSIISIAAWDQSLADVQSLIAGLASDVRVVTPEEITRLMAANVPHDVATQHDYTSGDFETTEMALVGDAFWTSDFDPFFSPFPNRLRLTNNGMGLNGSAWNTTPFDPTRSWTAAYRFQITYAANGGADGFGFHIQPEGIGANPGYSGTFTTPHLSVVIDTWNNGEGTDESLKVRLNGTEIYFNDLLDFAWDPTPGSSPTVFHMELDYLAELGELWIRLDDEGSDRGLRVSIPLDLSGLATTSWAGFSATTGASSQNHDIRTFMVTGAAPPP